MIFCLLVLIPSGSFFCCVGFTSFTTSGRRAGGAPLLTWGCWLTPRALGLPVSQQTPEGEFCLQWTPLFCLTLSPTPTNQTKKNLNYFWLQSIYLEADAQLMNLNSYMWPWGYAKWSLYQFFSCSYLCLCSAGDHPSALEFKRSAPSRRQPTRAQKGGLLCTLQAKLGISELSFSVS